MYSYRLSCSTCETYFLLFPLRLRTLFLINPVDAHAESAAGGGFDGRPAGGESDRDGAGRAALALAAGRGRGSVVSAGIFSGKYQRDGAGSLLRREFFFPPVFAIFSRQRLPAVFAAG